LNHRGIVFVELKNCTFETFEAFASQLLKHQKYLFCMKELLLIDFQKYFYF